MNEFEIKYRIVRDHNKFIKLYGYVDSELRHAFYMSDIFFHKYQNVNEDEMKKHPDFDWIPSLERIK